MTPALLFAPAALIPAMLVGVLAAQVAVAAVPDEVLTTDSAEYCRTLQARVLEIAQSHPPPPLIETLTQEGASMCRDGQTRAGILRLRRALMWERSGGSGGDEPVR